MSTIAEEAAVSRQVGTVREVVGVFDDQEHLQAAVDELQHCGFNRADISTVADFHTVEQVVGRAYAHVREIEDDTEIPRTIYVSKTSLGDAEGVLIGVAIYVPTVIAAAILASRGAADLTVVWAVLLIGALGGLLGYMVARWLDQRYVRRFREQLSHGGIVLWVAVRTPEQELRAAEVLRVANARDVHAHDLPIVIKPIPGWRGISYDLSFMKRLGM
ncbi:MAG TPA: hypothetical protein VKY65_21135 [Alphaproteobacteria bacterium]|nr:hypothetical protein [Alphaproteobacteria bacterium]